MQQNKDKKKPSTNSTGKYFLTGLQNAAIDKNLQQT